MFLSRSNSQVQQVFNTFRNENPNIIVISVEKAEHNKTKYWNPYIINSEFDYYIVIYADRDSFMINQKLIKI